MLAATPSEGLSFLKTVVVGGEACTAAVVERWGPGRRLIIGYGPSEATIAASFGASMGPSTTRSTPPFIPSVAEGVVEGPTEPPLRPGEIGHPVPNVRFHVLDAEGRPVPSGISGELFIGGAGVARGYLGRPAATAERFVPDPSPHAWRAPLPHRRPGARPRRRDLEFVGRVDPQVKLRGYRIELGEIQTHLALHPSVAECVVAAREDGGHKRLVAYVVRRGDLSPEELRTHLRTRLPDYMVPAAFVWLPALPLGPTGKADRKALPAPPEERPELAEGFVAPRSDAERKIAAVWERLLQRAPIGVNDGFFESGGDSILAIQVAFACSEAGLTVSPVDVLRHPTVSELARLAVAAKPTTRRALRSQEPFALSGLSAERIEALRQRFHAEGRGLEDPPALARPGGHPLPHAL